MGGRVGREEGGNEKGRRQEGECRRERGREEGVLGMNVNVCIGYECVFSRNVV